MQSLSDLALKGVFMWRILFVLVTCEFLLFGNLVALTSQEREWLDAHEQISIGVMNHWAPHGFLRYDGTPQGISVDMIEEFNKLLDNKLKIVSGAWSEIYTQAKAGKIHALMDITPSKDREKFFFFTAPYVRIPHVIVSNVQQARFLSLQELEGKTVALEKDFVAHIYLAQKYPKIKIRDYENTTQALDALSKKEVDAYIGNRAVVRHKMFYEFFDDLKIDAVESSVAGSLLSIGISKEYPLLASILQKTLAAIAPSELNRIFFKYSSESTLMQASPNENLALTKEQRVWLKEHRVIKYDANKEYPPFEFLQVNQKYSGIAIDYLRLLEKKIGVSFEIKPHSLEPVDMMSNCIKSTCKNEKYLNTKSLIKTPVVIMKRKEETKSTAVQLSELQGQKIAVLQNSPFKKEIFQEYPQLDIVEVENSKLLFEHLASGEFDAALSSLTQAGYYIHSLGLHNIEIVGKTPLVIELGFAVRHELEPLVGIVNKAIDSLSNEEHNLIYQKWVNVTIQEPIDYHTLAMVLLALSFVPLSLFYWNYQLNKKVKKKTLQLQELNESLESKVKERMQEVLDLSEERDAIIDTAPIGIALLKGEILKQVNKHLSEMFGYSKEEMLENTTQKWYASKEEYQARAQEAVVVAQGEIMQFKQRYIRKDKSEFMAMVTLRAIDIRDVSKGVVATFDDITLEEEAFEKIRSAKLLAEDATKAKSEFLANMSHELRTPMNSIMGMTYLTLQTHLDEYQKNYLRKIDNASKSLLGIINDILDVSKIEAGKMTLEHEPFELESVLEHISDLFLFKIQERGLELLFQVDADVPSAFVGDSLRLTQVLVNLVGNAIKFTKQGEITLKVSCIACDRKKATLRFDVEDTGIGINNELKERLFEPFAQADGSTTRCYGGTGLGLTISKYLVELMGGALDVVSYEGEGSDFFFILSLEVQKGESALVQEIQKLHHLRILVVDNDLPFKEVLEKMIYSLKFDVASVSSGSEAIVALEQAQREDQAFDIVFIDWIMPDMNGIETIKKIAQEQKLEKMPKFILISGHDLGELQERTFQNVSFEILAKPITPSTLYKTILQACGKEISLFKKEHTAQTPQEFIRSLSGAYLLLAEDNLQNQEVAIEFLTQVNIKVDVAQNGKEVLQKVQQRCYDGILMDCQMPIMDGYEATSEVRKLPQCKNIPIIAMTANALKGDKEKCLAFGMDDYIAKPIDVMKLYKTLAKWIQPRTPDTTTPLRALDLLIGLDKCEIEGLDLQEALSKMANNERLLFNQLHRFVESEQYFYQRVLEAQETGDTPAIIREVHTLKGLLGNIGDSDIAAQAQTIETLLKEEGLSVESLTQIKDLDSQLQGLIQQIQKAFGRMDKKFVKSMQEGANVLTQEKLLALFEELYRLYDDLDSSALEKTYVLSESLKVFEPTINSEKLLSHVNHFDFEQAAKALKEIEEKFTNKKG